MELCVISIPSFQKVFVGTVKPSPRNLGLDLFLGPVRVTGFQVFGDPQSHRAVGFKDHFDRIDHFDLSNIKPKVGAGEFCHLSFLGLRAVPAIQ